MDWGIQIDRKQRGESEACDAAVGFELPTYAHNLRTRSWKEPLRLRALHGCELGLSLKRSWLNLARRPRNRSRRWWSALPKSACLDAIRKTEPDGHWFAGHSIRDAGRAASRLLLKDHHPDDWGIGAPLPDTACRSGDLIRNEYGIGHADPHRGGIPPLGAGTPQRSRAVRRRTKKQDPEEVRENGWKNIYPAIAAEAAGAASRARFTGATKKESGPT